MSGGRLTYAETLKWLRGQYVTWDKAMEMRDLPESQLDEAALREYLKEAAVEFRPNSRRHISAAR